MVELSLRHPRVGGACVAPKLQNQAKALLLGLERALFWSSVERGMPQKGANWLSRPFLSLVAEQPWPRWKMKRLHHECSNSRVHLQVEGLFGLGGLLLLILKFNLGGAVRLGTIGTAVCL